MVALCIVGFLLGRWQNLRRESGSFDPATRAVQALVDPASKTLDDASDGVSHFWNGIANARSLSAENESLKARISALLQYQESNGELSAQLDQVRKLMALPRYGERWRIPAEAVGYAPYEDRLTISAGRLKGVRVGLPVVTADGLLGVVQVVDESTSQILLLSSRLIRVGAMAVRNPPQPGILQGEAPDRLVLGFIDTQTQIEVGDLVATSGFSETIPRGIPIGKIIQIESNPDFGVRKAKVFPFARIGTVHEVFVLR